MRTLTRGIKDLGKRLAKNYTYLSFARCINKQRKKIKKEDSLENFIVRSFRIFAFGN